METSTYRKLQLSELDQAVEVISQAFVNDPLCVFMLPNQRTRLKDLRKFFHLYARLYIHSGRGYGVGEPLKGVSYWLEPGQDDLSVSISALKMFIPILLSSYPIGYIKARPIIKQTDLLHKKYAIEPHYYLDNLAVLPAEQGKGFSSQLLRPVLEKADAEGVMVYTDTVTHGNVALYEHFGFHVVEECSVGKTGIKVWALLRSPGQE